MLIMSARNSRSFLNSNRLLLLHTSPSFSLYPFIRVYYQFCIFILFMALKMLEVVWGCSKIIKSEVSKKKHDENRVAMSKFECICKALKKFLIISLVCIVIIFIYTQSCLIIHVSDLRKKSLILSLLSYIQYHTHMMCVDFFKLMMITLICIVKEELVMVH